MYNSMAIFMYIGRQCDPYFLNQIFNVQAVNQIDKAISEDEMFAGVSESGYMNALYKSYSDSTSPSISICISVNGCL